MGYTYDTLGNLTTRTDANNNLTETYLYDTLNRLTTATATSGAVNTTTSFAFDAIGNITCKSDISTCSSSAANYVYNASGQNSIRPHAVASITGTINGVVNPAYTYDANGNMTDGAGRTTVWTSFNIPGQITSQTPNGAKTAQFWYNPEHERTKELQADQSIVITLSPRYDTGLHFEKKYIAAAGVLTGAVEYEHYLYAGGMMFGKRITVTTTDGVTIASTSLEYYSKDNLGSIVAITDQTGAVMQRLSYDPWGKRRYPNGTADPNGLLNNPDMYHGYTGHEMLDDVGLIHMNGRLYDPVTARFLSADPHIQDPLNLQSYNRYAYIWNNPLNSTDPSGYFKVFGINITPRVIVAAVVAYATAGAVNTWVMGSAVQAAGGAMAITSAQFATATITAGIASGAAAGFTGSMVMTNGNISASLQGAVVGAAFGGLDAYGTTNNFNGFQTTAANATLGGTAAKMQGSSFADGFKYSGISTGVSEAYNYVVGYGANPLPGEGVARRGPNAPPPMLANTVGQQLPLTGDFWKDMLREGSPLSNFLNRIPGVNAVSKFHDNIVIRYDVGTVMREYVANYPTMIPSAVVTYGALLKGPLSVQLAVKPQ